MSCLSEVGLSRKQRVFVTLEATCGTLTFPNATNDFIRPAGDAVMNQNPTFVDSDEKRDTLDVLDRFQNSMPPGTWSIPMYLRLPDKSYATPQGDNLFHAWQGDLVTGTIASNQTNWATSTPTLIHLDNISATPTHDLPGVGVVQVASGGTTQVVHYGVLYQAENAATASLGDLTMGWDGSTAATANANGITNVTLLSRFYNQDTNSPSVSIWIETDHFVQGMAGCTVNNVSLGVNNEGAVTFEFSGEGMEMIWAGEADLFVSATAACSHCVVAAGQGERFTVGSYIYNSTTTPGGASAASIGFLISAITAGAGEGGGDLITFATPITGPRSTEFGWELPAGGWASADTIRGYLPITINDGALYPAVDSIGTPIESRLTDIEINDVAAKVKGIDMTFSVPKVYTTDEVGTDFPEDYMENTREITSTLSVYFTKARAVYFTQGYDGDEVPVLLTLGSTQGDRMEIYMKRCALEVPTIGFEAPAVTLSIPLKALGTYGEDSCDVVLT